MPQDTANDLAVQLLCSDCLEVANLAGISASSGPLSRGGAWLYLWMAVLHAGVCRIGFSIAVVKNFLTPFQTLLEAAAKQGLVLCLSAHCSLSGTLHK